MKAPTKNDGKKRWENCQPSQCPKNETKRNSDSLAEYQESIQNQLLQIFEKNWNLSRSDQYSAVINK